MKHLLNTLFFGYFPLGWKRVFRVIAFVLFLWWLIASIMAINERGNLNFTNEPGGVWHGTSYAGISLTWLAEIQIYLVFGVLFFTLLSYVITGFIKQEKT
jgi:hypothetical protein